MERIRSLAFALVLGAVSLGTIWYVQDLQAASRSKVIADCTHQANQLKLGATSVKRKNFLRDCLRQRGFSGPP
jgi:hypothetical protein